ncbi:MAG: hypothetical protein EHM58_13950 [Ignavibacteriae bacterium]|nr:MAG: hypothetical protein EHM58_13950 [Ignavibacteriota bacterium]
MDLAESIRIGLIQTTTDKDSWNNEDINMPLSEKIRTQKEIKLAFNSFNNSLYKPHIILLPEISIPLGYMEKLRKISCKTGAVIISGLDFSINKEEKTVQNLASILIPQNWPSLKPTRSSIELKFGKAFCSNEESILFEKRRFDFIPDSSFYILNANQFGLIGVAICSDFFDIERFVLYKGLIHHMFVISYNQDINSFYYLCEAISRLVFCNVIICNTGYYGGSVVYSPFRSSYRRTIYKHEGSGLFTSQIVELPVKILDDAQLGNNNNIFKSLPPGYEKKTFSKMQSNFNNRKTVKITL